MSTGTMNVFASSAFWSHGSRIAIVLCASWDRAFACNLKMFELPWKNCDAWDFDLRHLHHKHMERCMFYVCSCMVRICILKKMSHQVTHFPCWNTPNDALEGLFFQARKKPATLELQAFEVVRHQGFEPWTPWLRVRCSASWANDAQRWTLDYNTTGEERCQVKFSNYLNLFYFCRIRPRGAGRSKHTRIIQTPDGPRMSVTYVNCSEFKTLVFAMSIVCTCAKNKFH